MSEDDHVKLEVPICENLPQIFEKFHDLIGHPEHNYASYMVSIFNMYIFVNLYFSCPTITVF